MTKHTIAPVVRALFVLGGALSQALACAPEARTPTPPAASAGGAVASDERVQTGPPLYRPTQPSEAPRAREVSPVRRDARDRREAQAEVSAVPGDERVSHRAAPASGGVAPHPGPSGVRVLGDRGAAPPNPAPPQPGEPEQLRVDTAMRAFALPLPLGCSRLSVVGTPSVTNLSVQVLGPGVDPAVHDQERGRTESVEVCAAREGRYQVQVRMQGDGSGVAAAQLFLDRGGGRLEEITAAP